MTTKYPVLDRRSFLALTGVATVLAACSSSDTTSGSTTQAATGDDSSASVTTGDLTDDTRCSTPPTETAGPFPGNGTNDNGEGEVANVLADTRCLRSDIRSNLDGSGTQDGVPMTLLMNVNDAACTPLVGAAVYVWHCNRDGSYSMYSGRMAASDQTEATWLRGAQIVDASGLVRFETILPGRYSGRASHIHFEVYADDSFDDLLLTSQLAFDDDTVDALYAAASGYEQSTQGQHNASDNQFSDGVEEQLLTIEGDVSSSLTASITISVG